jgi:diguanylate cyclase (GGDEF)-like protein
MRRTPSALLLIGYFAVALLLGFATPDAGAQALGLTALLSAISFFVAYQRMRRISDASLFLFMCWIVGSTVGKPGLTEGNFWIRVTTFAPAGMLTLAVLRAWRDRVSPARLLIGGLVLACFAQLTGVFEIATTSSTWKPWLLLLPLVYVAVLLYAAVREKSGPAVATAGALLLWIVLFVVSLTTARGPWGWSMPFCIAAALAGPLLQLLSAPEVITIHAPVGTAVPVEGPVSESAPAPPAAAPVADSYHDALTGAHNRRGLDAHGSRLYTESLSSDRPVSILMLDIDHFKHVNDLYGHAAGDCVLQCFAQVVSAQVRGTDFVARYGGEEFAIVLPNAPLAPAMRLAEQMRKAVQECEIDYNGRKLKITTSVGVTATFPGDDSDFATTLARADRNLYRAKRYGRNRVMADPLPGEI